VCVCADASNSEMYHIVEKKTKENPKKNYLERVNMKIVKLALEIGKRW